MNPLLKILNRKGFTEQWLNENQDICYTKRRKEKLLFTSDIVDSVIELLQQEQKEIGDNDEIRAIDFVPKLLKKLGKKPFKGYLRCKEPSAKCFSCQFILQCREIYKDSLHSKHTEAEK